MRLCRQLRCGAVIAAIVSAIAVSGCSYRLASLGSNDDTDSTLTSSIAPRADETVHNAPAAQSAGGAAHSPHGSGLADVDLAYARAAASNVLSRGGTDSSVPWQNPQTGAGGNITPLDTSYREDGLSCRDFLASYVHGTAQDWLQGAACRSASGTWQVTRLTPLKSG
ncbi:MAG: RT0821/Lpp0805 family surface protein [Xanthobacteraceae bacterium]